MPTTVTLLAVVSALALVVFIRRTSKDPYGLFHLALNRLPGEAPDSLPKTEWLNQGYWKDTISFPQACRALALKLVEAAKLTSGARILDVGHGTGESLIMFLKDPVVPRPSRVVGITSLSPHHKRSKERVSRLQSSSTDAATVKVDLFHGDAICRTDYPDHPLHPLNLSEFDAVFALDCAYHFVTRKVFLAQAYRKLSPGGRIALGDMCFDPSALSGWQTFFITSCMGVMPKENMISPQEYVQIMEDVGYTDIVLEDITTNVFPGMAKFLPSKGFGWWLYATFLSWYTNITQTRFVVVSGQRPIDVME